MTQRRPSCHPRRIAAGAIVLALAAGAAADQVVLQSGDVLFGDVVERTDDVVTLTHAVLGRLEIPMADVASISIDDSEAPAAEEPVAVTAPAAEAPAAEEAAAIETPKEWSYSVSLSGAGTWGNTDEQTFRAGFTGARKRVDTRLTLDAAYYGGVTDGATSDNNFTAGARRDWLFPGSKWFLFVAGRYDYDQFQSWDHRVSGQFGPGYHLIERDDFTLDLLGGVGPRKEWGSEDDSWKFEGMVGLDFTRKISERQSLEGGTRFFWVFDDTENYRTRSTLNYALKLDPELNLSFLAGVRHEYQNVVDPGDDRNLTNAFFGLQVDF